MSKYKKKLLNIWKTFDPKNPDEELNEFIREFHPSIFYFKDGVSGESDKLNLAIKLFKDGNNLFLIKIDTDKLIAVGIVSLLD